MAKKLPYDVDIIEELIENLRQNCLVDIYMGWASEEAKKSNIGIIAELLKSGMELPPNLKIFIVDALTKIADGHDPAEALYLKKQGRPKRSKNNAFAIAISVWLRVKFYNRSISKAAQSNRICNHYKITPDVAKKIYFKLRNTINAEYENILLEKSKSIF